jgi:hypothetical protein
MVPVMPVLRGYGVKYHLPEIAYSARTTTASLLTYSTVVAYQLLMELEFVTKAIQFKDSSATPRNHIVHSVRFLNCSRMIFVASAFSHVNESSVSPLANGIGQSWYKFVWF